MFASDFRGNIERFTGFADIYDRYRPAPPEALAGLLGRFAKTEHPALVVDLGCGTGLSTRYWADKADRVVGVDPTEAMRAQAMANGLPNLEYRQGFSHDTGLPDGCADIVTCSQSLHWMEPTATFAEARRILRPGGVFASCDYDWPPATGMWEADAAYLECVNRCRELEKSRGIADTLRRWEKGGHLSRIRESGEFRYTAEVLVHHFDEGNAERLAGLLLSQGGTESLLKLGLSEAEIGLEKLRAEADRWLGAEPRKWHWSSRVRIGVV